MLRHLQTGNVSITLEQEMVMESTGAKDDEAGAQGAQGHQGAAGSIIDHRC